MEGERSTLMKKAASNRKINNACIDWHSSLEWKKKKKTKIKYKKTKNKTIIITLIIIIIIFWFYWMQYDKHIHAIASYATVSPNVSQQYNKTGLTLHW